MSYDKQRMNDEYMHSIYNLHDGHHGYVRDLAVCLTKIFTEFTQRGGGQERDTPSQKEV